tara:strand:- start:709 stop:1320 length:612 start_codon:yes stop_codon:yes gene_type:complete
MQNFDTFAHVFSFFVKSHYNQFYVINIDKSIQENTIDEDTTKMIENVKEFHTMRHQLCGKIFDYLKKDKLLNTLVSARGLEQFDIVPNNSLCSISGVKLNAKSGILLYVNSSQVQCITVHKRYKQILYNFWYLVHFVDEIMVDISIWLKKNMYTSSSSVIAKIIHHQDQLFIKQGYVKLKNINKYIQSEMSRLPINHSVSRIE